MRDGGGTTPQRPMGRASALVLLVVLSLAPACGADDAEQTPVEAFCSGVCGAATRCQVADATCSSSCAQSAHVERYSNEGARHLGDCLDGLTCSAFSDETVWNEQFNACWQSSKPLVPVTEHVRGVCSRYVEASFECSSLYSTEQCELDLRMWSDDMLDAAAACFPAPDCDSVGACLKGVFG